MRIFKYTWWMFLAATMGYATDSILKSSDDFILRDADKVREEFNLNQYPYHTRLEDIKVAVIDRGFGRIGDSTDHGLRLVKILHALSGADQISPVSKSILAIPFEGIKQLELAVQQAIDANVKIILFAQNLEYLGNFNGKGPVNRIIDKAIRAGIIWINAAGNYGGRVYNGFVRADGATVEPGEWLQFKTKDGLRDHLRIKSNNAKNNVTITLAWNDQPDVLEDGTNKDLDLYLLDENNKIVAQETYRQVLRKICPPKAKVPAAPVPAPAEGELESLPNVQQEQQPEEEVAGEEHTSALPSVQTPKDDELVVEPPGNGTSPFFTISTPNGQAGAPQTQVPAPGEPTQNLEEEEQEGCLAENESYVPGERIDEVNKIKLKENSKNKYYKIKVKVKSNNFTSADRLRITVMETEGAGFNADTGTFVDGVTFVDATEGEEIMVGGDHPDVITSGSFSPRSPKGPTMDGRMKPDVIMTRNDALFNDMNGGRMGDTIAATYTAANIRQLMAYWLAHTGEFLTLREVKTLIAAMPEAKAIGVHSLVTKYSDANALREKFPMIYGQLEAAVGYQPAAAGHYNSDGRYLLAIVPHPSLLKGVFPEIPEGANPEHYEYYLLQQYEGKQVKVKGFVRSIKVNSEGQGAAYPWDAEKLDKKYFVEVRRARTKEELANESKRIGKLWVTPTFKEMTKTLGR